MLSSDNHIMFVSELKLRKGRQKKYSGRSYNAAMFLFSINLKILATHKAKMGNLWTFCLITLWIDHPSKNLYVPFLSSGPWMTKVQWHLKSDLWWLGWNWKCEKNANVQIFNFSFNHCSKKGLTDFWKITELSNRISWSFWFLQFLAASVASILKNRSVIFQMVNKIILTPISKPSSKHFLRILESRLTISIYIFPRVPFVCLLVTSENR